jgi:G3E family GTPase
MFRASIPRHARQYAINQRVVYSEPTTNPGPQGDPARPFRQEPRRAPSWPRSHRSGHGHEHPDVNRHDDRIRAFCITREQPISWAALSTWLDGLAAMRGDDVLRLKAIVALSDRPDQPVVLHGVQHLFHPPVLLPEWPSEDRRTRMVFIHPRPAARDDRDDLSSV